MNHLFIKKVAVVVLLSFFLTFVAPAYSLEQDSVVKAKNQIEKLYQEGDLDEVVKLIDEFIDKYSNQKEKYVSEFCSVYHIRAKIFFYIQDIEEMKKALLNLYHTDPSYQIYSGEKEFMDIANKIKKAVEFEIKQSEINQNKGKVKNENIPRKFPVTLEILVEDDISNDVSLRVDDLGSEDVIPFKQKKAVLELEPGRYRFYFILGKKEKYLIEEREIKGESYYQFPLDFSSGKDLKTFFTSSGEGKMIPKPAINKKKRFPVMLVVAGVTVGVAIALFIKQKVKKSSDLSPYFITDTPEVSMKEGETATLQVKLSQLPSSNINVTVRKQKGDRDISIQSGQSLVFTPFDWDNYQGVSIKAEKDWDDEDDDAIIRISADGTRNKDIPVYVEDKDKW